MQLGSICFVSIFVIVIRRHYFRLKLADVVKNSAAGRKALEDVEYQEHKETQSHKIRSKFTSNSNVRRRRHDQGASLPISYDGHPRRSIHYGYGGFPAPWQVSGLRGMFKRPFQSFTQDVGGDHHSYLSFSPRIDRKGRVHALNEYERAELGGVEYRALGLLLWALLMYQVFWITLGTILIVPYSYRQSMKSTIHDAQPGNLNPGFYGFFMAATSFANCGLMPINESLVPFRGFYYLLILAAVLTYAGNTQFPIYLRFSLWLTNKILPNKSSRFSQTLRFLLDHPRRCYIYLFPSKETWILLAIQWGIDLLLWVSFEVLNLGLAPVTDTIPVRPRVFDGLFQTTGIRTSGAYIITMSSLAPALLVIYLVFMYIGTFPVIMTMRQTNTYEERSIGQNPSHGHNSAVGMHIRNQLAYDLWFQLLAWFLICVIERPQLTGGAGGFTLFSILFEVVSGYGTVGLSTGVPYDDYSLSGQFHTLSKIVMLAVMLRGRHRGLPLAIDRSILLPGQDLMNNIDAEYREVGKISIEEEQELRKAEENSGKPREGKSGRHTEEQDPELSITNHSGHGTQR